jgi:hypothetical protein
MKTENRRTKRYTIAAQAGVVSALALGVILVGSGPTRAFARAACEASFEPSAVPAGSEAATVFYRLSEGIGELEGVSAESGSGLAVSGRDGEMSTLSLNTADAKPGNWGVTFHGQDDQTCTGSLEVSQPEDTRT